MNIRDFLMAHQGGLPMPNPNPMPNPPPFGGHFQDWRTAMNGWQDQRPQHGGPQDYMQWMGAIPKLGDFMGQMNPGLQAPGHRGPWF